MFRTTGWIAASVLFLASVTSAEPQNPTPTDTLPKGASLRLGSTDFWLGEPESMRVMPFLPLPDGKQAITLQMGVLNLWDMKTGRITATAKFSDPPKPPTQGLRGASAAPDGKSVVIPRDGLAVRYPIPLKDSSTTLPAPGVGETIQATAFGAKSDAVYAFTSKERLIKWNPGDQNWTELSTGMSYKGVIGICWPSAGGGILACPATKERDMVRLWDTNTDKELKSVEIHALMYLALSSDGRLLATQSGEPTSKHLVQIWDTREAKLVSSWEANLTSPPAFSPDGTLLVHGIPTPGIIEVHEVKTGKLRHTIQGFTGGPKTLHFLLNSSPPDRQ